MDFLETIYNALISDSTIASNAAGKIKYYEFPENTTITDGAYIMIQPLDVPVPTEFGDNQYIKYDVLMQIETWSKSRELTRTIAERIERTMWGLGFLQTGGLNEFDAEIFRDARRYRGKFYSDYFMSDKVPEGEIPGGENPVYELLESITGSLSKIIATLFSTKTTDYNIIISSSSGLEAVLRKDISLDLSADARSSFEANLRKNISLNLSADASSSLEAILRKNISFGLAAESISALETNANIIRALAVSNDSATLLQPDMMRGRMLETASASSTGATGDLNIISPAVPGEYRFVRYWGGAGWYGTSTIYSNNPLAEIQVNSTADGNVLLNKLPIETIADDPSYVIENFPNLTDGSFDNSISTTYWSKYDNLEKVPNKITYDLGKGYADLTEFTVLPYVQTFERWYNFKIEVCETNSPDPADWVTIVDAMDNKETHAYPGDTIFTFPIPPQKPIVEVTNLYNAVRLDWASTTYTTSYNVYRSDTAGTIGTILTGGANILEPTFTDTTAIGGTTYYYTVQAVNANRTTDSEQMTAVPSAVQIYESRDVGFDGAAWAIYDDAMAIADFGNIKEPVQGGDRLKIDSTLSRLRFFLPVGQLGSANTGGIIKAGIVGKTEYNFEYEIRFDSGFPWSMGGKIPGFSGGVGYTGGESASPGDGFSVRIMWREGGRLIPYVYHTRMEGTFGDTFGKTLGYVTDTKSYMIRYYAKLNTGDNQDGILRIYLDDVEVLNKTDLTYRTDDSKIDTAHLSIFAGGSTPEWNMTGDGYIRLSNFKWW